MKYALVVGAGFAGATTARELAEAGWTVTVIDSRNHIAGNAFDYVNEHGIRVHKYGPHLWHTSNADVHAWASKFTEWVPYEHHVRAQLPDGRTTPLPINDQTIEDVFGARFAQWCSKNGYINRPDADSPFRHGAHQRFLDSLIIVDPEDGDGIETSLDHVYMSVGQELCDLFFGPYTKKMWGLELDDLPATVAARIPTSVGSKDPRYFPKDTFQFLPKEGYTRMFDNILSHPNIHVNLGVTHDMMARAINNGWGKYEGQTRCNEEGKFDAIFTSEAIDAYYGCSKGELPWRSVRMHVVSVPLVKALPSPVLNFTHDEKFTRVTEWKQLPAHGENPAWTTMTFEEPCDYRENGLERYYPVKTADREDPNRKLYLEYKKMAEEEGIHFIGRCGMYVYSDMGPTISSTLAIVRKFLEKQDAQV